MTPDLDPIARVTQATAFITTTCWDCRREFRGPRSDGRGGPLRLPEGISHLDGESRAFCSTCAYRRQGDGR